MRAGCLHPETGHRSSAILACPHKHASISSLSWTSQPDFTLVFGAQRRPAAGEARLAGRVACLDLKHEHRRKSARFCLSPGSLGCQLVLLAETAQKADLVPLQKIAAGAGRCHFRIYLDQAHNRAIVFGADGGQLADLAIADAPSHTGACLRLINHHGNVRLEQLSIVRWNGQPPNDMPGEVATPSFRRHGRQWRDREFRCLDERVSHRRRGRGENGVRSARRGRKHRAVVVGQPAQMRRAARFGPTVFG